jgi:hypothetical protein
VRCIVAERFPVIEARIAPPDRLSRARVFFRSAGTPNWYFVEMRPEKGSFHGTLPKPMKTTTSIEYYIDALDRSVAETRTPEYAPQVVSAGSCPSNMAAAAFVASAKIAVGALTGGPAVPLGFSSAGVVSAGVGGAAAGGATASGTGGGLSTGAVVGIVGGAGALAAGAVVVTRGDSSHWVGTADLSPADRSCRSDFALDLDLTQKGSDLSGRVTLTVTNRSGSPNAFGCGAPVGSSVNTRIISGSASGSNVTFAISIVGGAENSTITFTGTQSGSSMEGTVAEAPNDAAHIARNGTWRTTRQ